MSSIDEEWASFLTEGAIILSNEKNTAKNIKKSYSDTDKLTDTMTSINPVSKCSEKISKKNTKNTKNSTKQCKKGIPPQSYLDGNSEDEDEDDEDDDHDDEGNHVVTQKYNKSQIKNMHSHNMNDVSDNDEDDELSLHNLLHLENTPCQSLPSHSQQPQQQPKCSDIYISTKTKISYLNMPIDIKKVFWSIPISPYSTPQECIIKKQIKVSTTDPNELAEIKNLLKNEKYYQEQEIEHIDNPEGRIKFKVQLKINIGLCKKDILNYRCKLKRAFFNCFVLILRIKDRASDSFKEMHVKVFNTGKLEIPGIQTDESLTQVLDLLISTLTPIVGNNIGYIPNKCETVLINSNFNCGYFINRDKLYNILKYKYRINSNYDACSYPGIQCKFYFMSNIDMDKQNGQQPPSGDMSNANEISFMIFRTGSVLIVGRCDENVLHCIYKFLKNLLETEYPDIGNQLNIIEPKKHNVKLRRKIINVTENI
jgi:hypothetical protein